MYTKNDDDQTKWMYFLTEDDNLLKKHNTRWDKVSAVIKREFNIEPIYSKKFLETKINLMVVKLQIFIIKKLLR